MGMMPSRHAANFPLLPAIAAMQNHPVLPSVVPTAAGIGSAGTGLAAGIASVAGSTVSTQAANSGPLVAVPAGMFLGEGLVPLPAKLVQRIIGLEYVEMYELLPESWLAADGSDTNNSGQPKAVSIFPKCRRALITDVLMWVQCFSALVGALSTKFPGKVPEFMAYQAVIVKCSRDYEGISWVLYDRAFRQQVAVTKSLNWSRLNPTLQIIIFGLLNSLQVEN